MKLSLASADSGDRTILALALLVFAGGLCVGVILATDPRPVTIAGLTMIGLLTIPVLLLARITRKTRQRVTASEASYRAFFDHAVEGIFRTTSDGRYLAVNQALADIYGYPAPAALISGLTDIGAQLYVDSSRREEFRARMQAHDVVTNFVSEIYHASGRRIWISENARAIRDWSGALLCYEGTVEDVTEKIAADCALRTALRQAETANRVKAAFLAAMSHELKTPLNAVLGFSEIIRDEMLGPVGQPVYREYASDIHNSGARLLAVINDVLDVTKLESGSMVLDEQLENPHDILEQAIRLARKATGDAREVFCLLPDLVPALAVDARRLAQALGNIVSNAMKFTPPGGEISLSFGLASDGGARFTVRDTGIGMAGETLTAALEPFHQLDGSLARRFEGAGLGLPIARALTELHDGTLEIVSAIGTGTSVTLALPPARVSAQASRMLSA